MDSAYDIELDEGYAENTRIGYELDWRTFVRWCGLSHLDPLPATPETVARFVEEHSETRAPATNARRVAAIATVHRSKEMSDPTKARCVVVAMKRMYRKRGRRQKQALAISFERRTNMLAAADCDLRGLRDRAMLAVAYDIGGRRSEVVAICAEDIEVSPDGTGLVVLRRSKTDQEGEGSVNFLAADTVVYLDAWMTASGIEEGHLFRAVTGGVVHQRPLRPQAVSDRWRHLSRAAAEPDEIVRATSSHSTRVGMAQDMAGVGIDLVAIMQAGRWKSPTMVARYVERLQARKGASSKLASAQGR